MGIAHHFGWAIAVTATSDHTVTDRRRIELIEPGVVEAPIHYRAAELDDAALAALVAEVRASAVRATTTAFDELATAAAGPIESISIRLPPADFPTGDLSENVAVLRRAPHESRADSVMYLQVLAECARARSWTVHHFDAKRVEVEAAERLGARADDVLKGPRAVLGPPWNKDHRAALAATIVAGE